jgi:hypothetical protein
MDYLNLVIESELYKDIFFGFFSDLFVDLLKFYYFYFRMYKDFIIYDLPLSGYPKITMR